MKPRRLEDFHGPRKQSGQQWNFRDCPVCGSATWKVYVNPDTGKWICFAGICGARGQVRTFTSAETLRDRLFTRGRGVVRFPAMDLPENRALGEAAERMVRLRYHIGQPHLYLLTEGVGDWEGRILIPYAEKDGTIVYFSGRSVYSDGPLPKYKGAGGKHPLYIPQFVRKHDWPMMLDLQRTVVLVEGAFDAMSLHARMRVDAVALGGKTLAAHLVPHLKEYVGGRRILIMLDPDALSNAIALKHRLDGLFPKSEVRILQLPGGTDPASASDGVLGGVLL